MKKDSFRLCIATNKKYLKEDLLRVVKIKSGEIHIDLQQKIDGRGCYFYPTIENKELVIKKRLLNRVFRTNVSNNIYEQIGDIKIEK